MGDATELDLEEGGADVVFSNWLLMYLDDDEVYDLASDALAWVCLIMLAFLLTILLSLQPCSRKVYEQLSMIAT